MEFFAAVRFQVRFIKAVTGPGQHHEEFVGTIGFDESSFKHLELQNMTAPFAVVAEKVQVVTAYVNAFDISRTTESDNSP
jgi:hypothetical protein